MKTKEGLKDVREEAEALNKKIKSLSEDELKAVAGGSLEKILREEEEKMREDSQN